MLKNGTKLIDIETETEWRIEARTRGKDIQRPGEKPCASWVFVLSNRAGERRFVAEKRIEEFMRLPESESSKS